MWFISEMETCQATTLLLSVSSSGEEEEDNSPVEHMLAEGTAPSNRSSKSTNTTTTTTPASHPSYLLSHLFNVHSKKVIIGYSSSTAFEVKICIISEKKPFVELSMNAFSAFYVNCEKIYQDYLKNQKGTYILEETGDGKMLIKVSSSKKGTTSAALEDTFRQVKITLSESELLLMIKYRHCFSYIMQSLLFNKSNVISYYHTYVQNCVNLGVKSLQNHQLMNGMSEFRFYNIDSLELFHSIPVAMESQLEKDIYFRSIVPPI